MLAVVLAAMLATDMEAKAQKVDTTGNGYDISQLEIGDIIALEEMLYNDTEGFRVFAYLSSHILIIDGANSDKLSNGDWRGLESIKTETYQIYWIGGSTIDIIPVKQESGIGGGSGNTGTSVGSSASSGMTEEERKAYEKEQREKAWKVSESNPDNYLPKVTLSDGNEVQSTVPSHYTGKEDGNVASVLTTQVQRDFHAALGITGNAYAHMNAYQSQCGPKMREAFDIYARSLGALLGNDMTIGDIIELQMEVREKDTYKLLDTVTESTVPVELIVALQGDLLEKAEAGNELVLLCYADGEFSYYVDTDAEASTLTVSTTKTSGIFAIAYAPKGTFIK